MIYVGLDKCLLSFGFLKKKSQNVTSRVGTVMTVMRALKKNSLTDNKKCTFNKVIIGLYFTFYFISLSYYYSTLFLL